MHYAFYTVLHWNYSIRHMCAPGIQHTMIQVHFAFIFNFKKVVLRAHNCQNEKVDSFHICPCRKIYRVEAVGHLFPIIHLKLWFLWNRLWNLGQFVNDNLIHHSHNWRIHGDECISITISFHWPPYEWTLTLSQFSYRLCLLSATIILIQTCGNEYIFLIS